MSPSVIPTTPNHPLLGDMGISDELKGGTGMDWSNRFTFGGFTVTYCTFEMAWEVIEKRDGYEVAFRWFYSKKKAEAFCVRVIGQGSQLRQD